MADKGWQRKFDDPITLSLLDGRTLVTLRDAAQYITKLPRALHESAEWRVAMEVLLLVAEHDAPEIMARVAMLKALHRIGPNSTAAARRQRSKAYRIIR
jgi:hypothetical protein